MTQYYNDSTGHRDSKTHKDIMQYDNSSKQHRQDGYVLIKKWWIIVGWSVGGKGIFNDWDDDGVLSSLEGIFDDWRILYGCMWKRKFLEILVFTTWILSTSRYNVNKLKQIWCQKTRSIATNYTIARMSYSFLMEEVDMPRGVIDFPFQSVFQPHSLQSFQNGLYASSSLWIFESTFDSC